MLIWVARKLKTTAIQPQQDCILSVKQIKKIVDVLDKQTRRMRSNILGPHAIKNLGDEWLEAMAIATSAWRKLDKFHSTNQFLSTYALLKFYLDA